MNLWENRLKIFKHGFYRFYTIPLERELEREREQELEQELELELELLKHKDYLSRGFKATMFSGQTENGKPGPYDSIVQSIGEPCLTGYDPKEMLNRF